jgi:hypothetical protein
MKTLVLTSAMVLALAIAAGPGYAQAGTQTVTGHLVDVMCATKHAGEGAKYGATHDKSCLLMDGCVKSGYSVLTADNKVVKLDAKGSAMALELIRKTAREKDWKVTVNGSLAGDTIVVSSLTLQ